MGGSGRKGVGKAYSWRCKRLRLMKRSASGSNKPCRPVVASTCSPRDTRRRLPASSLRGRLLSSLDRACHDARMGEATSFRRANGSVPWSSSTCFGTGICLGNGFAEPDEDTTGVNQIDLFVAPRLCRQGWHSHEQMRMKRLDRQNLLIQSLNSADHDATHRVILFRRDSGMVREMDGNLVTCDDGEAALPVLDLKAQLCEESQRTVKVIDGHDGNGPQKRRWILGWSLRTHLLLSFRLGYPAWLPSLVLPFNHPPSSEVASASRMRSAKRRRFPNGSRRKNSWTPHGWASGAYCTALFGRYC